MDAGHPDADPGDDLVVDRAEGVRPVLCGGFAVIPRPEQDHLVACLDRIVADVHHELVHADGSGDTPTPAREQHLGGVAGRPRDAVGVPERYQSKG